MANEEHLKILKQGPHSWKQWQEDHAGTQPDLVEADLSQSNLGEADLAWADLCGANLSSTNLREADLFGRSKSDYALKASLPVFRGDPLHF